MYAASLAGSGAEGLGGSNSTVSRFFDHRVRRSLLFVITAELALMGDGRLLTIGPLTFRMFLFGVALVWTAYSLLRGDRLRLETVALLSVYTSLLILGVLESAAAGHDTALIFANVKPLTYFYLLPFFELAIQTEKDVDLLGRVLMYSGLLLAVAYLAILLLQLAGIIPPVPLFLLLSGGPSDEPSLEFMGRTDPETGILLFTYKGFIYLCFGAVLWAMVHGKRKMYAVICAAAIFFTLVRGYFLALISAFLVYFLLFEKRRWVRYALLSTTLILSSAAYVVLSTQRGEDANSLSNQERVETFQQVSDRVTAASALIGHGLGAGVPIREVNMEISYLQFFHQQGIAGLLFWLYILLSTTLLAWRIASDPGRNREKTFYLLFCIVFVETATNPTINNPIGLGPVLMVFVIMRKALQHEATGADLVYSAPELAG